MKILSKIYITIALALISFQAFAQESEVLCKDNYYLETALKDLNTALSEKTNYSVSPPSNSVGPNGHHTICVTLTKLNE